MLLIEGYRDIPRHLQGCLVTIGNFDGVHRGHREIFRRLAAEAAQRHAPTAVITFDPHPKMIIHRERRPFYLITTPEEKKALIEKAGIDALILIPFTPEFARTTADEFVRDILWARLRLAKILIGHDYTFGRDKGGNEELLKAWGRRLGFEVEVMNPFTVDGEVVSSTKVREAILAGEVERAARYLGRFYNLKGTVVEGRRRGTGLGFPTANIEAEKVLLPAKGVYAAFARLRGETHRAVLNIGTNPTFGDEALSVEVYLLDFRGMIYGEELEVLFVGRLREERKFSTPQELVAQIHRDVARAGEILAAAPTAW